MKSKAERTAAAMGGDSDSDGEFDLTSALIPQASQTLTKPETTKGKRVKKGTEPATAPSSDSDDSNASGSESEAEMIQREMKAQNRKKKKSGGFQSLGLHPPLFRAIMKKGFKVPTPIQRKTIPIILEGKDVVGMARTGSGKTAAFLIPMINHLKAHSVKVGSRAIILSPSRELALQTHQVTKELVKFTDLRAVPIVGGDSMEDQFGIMASNPDIIIATPGRLLHLIVEMNLDLTTVEYIVFDEADRLFELGFSVQLHEILGRLSANRQTLLFSATLPNTLVDFAKAGLQDPVLIRLDVETKISQDLEMSFFHLKNDEKDGALIYLLRDVIGAPVNTDNTIKSQAWRRFGSRPSRKSNKKGKKGKKGSDDEDESGEDSPKAKGQTIVFASTKHHVEYLNALLSDAGFYVSHIYGSLDQTARKIQISRFTSGKTHVLIVTDVAARGIDIPILENVINYDFVDSSKVFVHRVGRVARAGRRGWAYSLITSEELPYVLDLQLFLGRQLQLGTSVFKKRNITPDYTKEIVVGQFPIELSEPDNEWVVRRIADSIALEGFRRTALNGGKLYRKSKQIASSESYKRAKEIALSESFMEPHYLLSDKLKPEEKQRLDILKSLSSFRPNETIFEIGNRGIKHSSTAGLIMQNYRLTSGRYISETRQRRAEKADPMTRFDSDSEPDNNEETTSTPSAATATASTATNALLNPNNNSTYRDDEFYIPYKKKDFDSEKGYAMSKGGSFAEQAQGAILSLNGDENDSLLALQHAKQSSNSLRWDSKKKRFVKGLGIGSDNKKLIRTENGTMLPASFKSGTFKEWQERTRTSIPRVGESEITGASGFASRGKYATGKFKHTKVSAPMALDPLSVDYERKLKKRKQKGDDSNAADEGEKVHSGKKSRGMAMKNGRIVKNELKSREQIRKDRIELEKRRARNGRHEKKGKKGNRGGKRR